MTSSTGRQKRPTPEQLVFLQEAIAASSALTAAEYLGVLARFTAGSADPVALARDCAISERGARLLLGALTSLGLIEEASDGSYQTVTPELAQLTAMITSWGHLSEAIRDEQPVTVGNTASEAEILYAEESPYLGAWFAPVVERAAEYLVAQGLRVLGLGVGAALLSLALAAQNPDMWVTVVDLPKVLSVTRRVVANTGYDTQFDYLSGDLFTIDLGCSEYDLAIAGNLCHLFDEVTNLRLLRRLFNALRPGGKLAILDVLPNERLDGPRPVVLYALGLLLRTNRGQVYPFSTYVGWLREVGYEAAERIDLSEALPISLITARRPAAEEEL